MVRMGTSPLVSVIIPAYNGERYLLDAIESVLGQSYHPIEILVVDDGSTDSTAQTAKSYFDRIRYLRQENLGAGAARNHGVRESQGEYLAFLDADDLWAPEKLKSQISVLRQDKPPSMVFGHVKQFVSPELSEDDKAKIAIPAEVMRGFHIGTMVINRQTFDEIGWFSEDLEVGEFIDWFARAKDKGCQFQLLSDVVMHRRIHTTNQGIYKRHMQTDYARLMKSVLDRRRKIASS